MSLQVEKLEHNMAKLTIEASSEEFEKALQTAYQKNKKKISAPGFRKGKVPRNVIEKLYGKDVFYQDAAEELVPVAYERELTEHTEVEVVSRPKLEVIQVESGQPFIFTAEVALKPPVELGKYKGVKCHEVDVTVTDEDVEKTLEQERINNSRILDVEDRPVQDKDIVSIDFEGFVDGKAFEGGKGTDYDLTIGSHTFVDNFEEQLIGKNLGEFTDVKVTFPEDYREETLAGKEALFVVQIKKIKERKMPELDDEFASEISEYETLDEYREHLRGRIAEMKERDAKLKKEDELILAIIDDSKMDIPEAMVRTRVEESLESESMNARAYGLTLENFVSMYRGMPLERYTQEMAVAMKRNIQSRLVLEAIVEAENLEATDEDYEAEIEKTAHRYNMEKDQLVKVWGEAELKAVRMDLTIQKAVDFILENAEMIEEEKKETPAED